MNLQRVQEGKTAMLAKTVNIARIALKMEALAVSVNKTKTDF